MSEKRKWNDYDYKCDIWFRIPFTIYWVGRIQLGCKHEWSKLMLFTREFGNGDYYWMEL